MSVTAKNLINSGYALASDHTEYITPAGTRTIIDKFTVTNQDGSPRTITINIVPSGGTADASNIIVKALSLTAGQVLNVPEMQNQILEEGDFISCVASVASQVVRRASGREVTT